MPVGISSHRTQSTGSSRPAIVDVERGVDRAVEHPGLLEGLGRWIAVGACVAAPAALMVGRHGARGPVSRLGLGALVGSATAGALFVVDRWTGGGIDQSFRVAIDHAGDRHQIAFVARRAVGAPWLYPTARAVHHDAEREQVELFGRSHAIDDGIDAYRHAYASALMVMRVVAQRGWSTDEAARLARDAGRAHERDGVDNPAGATSRTMDLRNNDVGIAIGSKLAAEGGSEDRLRTLVIAAVRAGDLVLIEEGSIRPTTQRDIDPALGVES